MIPLLILAWAASLVMAWAIGDVGGTNKFRANAKRIYANRVKAITDTLVAKGFDRGLVEKAIHDAEFDSCPVCHGDEWGEHV